MAVLVRPARPLHRHCAVQESRNTLPHLRTRTTDWRYSGVTMQTRSRQARPSVRRSRRWGDRNRPEASMLAGLLVIVCAPGLRVRAEQKVSTALRGPICCDVSVLLSLLLSDRAGARRAGRIDGDGSGAAQRAASGAPLSRSRVRCSPTPRRPGRMMSGNARTAITGGLALASPPGLSGGAQSGRDRGVAQVPG
jgi:hypothetical protein